MDCAAGNRAENWQEIDGTVGLMAKRKRVIVVPDSWLEECRSWRENEGLSLEAAGATLARATKRVRPFGISTVRRYLSGELVTNELTLAFAEAMKVASPIQVIEKEQHRRWYELGVRLDDADSEAFEAELARLERTVNTTEELMELRKRKGK